VNFYYQIITATAALKSLRKKREYMHSNNLLFEHPNVSIEDLAVGIARQDIKGELPNIYNRFFLDMFGWESYEIDSMEKWFQLACPDKHYRKTIIDLWKTVCIETGSQCGVLSEKVKVKLACKDGSIRWCEARFHRKGQFLYGVFIDISTYYQSEERLRFALSGASDGLWDWNVESNEVYYSPRWYQMLGYQPCELPDGLDTWKHLMHPEQLEPTISLINDYLEGRCECFETELQMKHKDGHWVNILSRGRFAEDDNGNILTPKRLVGTHVDISERVVYQQKLEQMAHYDMLTGLPNRAMLTDTINQALASARRRGDVVAVVYLDLDGFKTVNDSHSHAVGDKLLVAIANELKKVVRKGDELARLGGDEFLIILSGLADAQSSTPIIQRILTSVSTPVNIDQLLLTVSASIGVSYYPQPEQVDADTLIRQADQAMYKAKQGGKNQYYAFDYKLDHRIRDDNEKLCRIRQGFQCHEFDLYYQPKVDLYNGQVVGAEALIRWNHPQRGVLPPSEFLTLLQNQKDIVEMGEFVLHQALRQIESWKSRSICIPLSVNIDGDHLLQGNFTDRLREILSQYPHVEPGDLELEIIETSALEDFDRVSQTMYECQELGVSFAIDDFGTGYSSLTYLKQLPAKTLKIDQSFVIDMIDDTEDLAILDGVLGLSNVFGRQVVAEGMESVLHGEFLLRMGCRVAQGYAIAKPMSADFFENWLLHQWVPDQELLGLKALNREQIAILYAAIRHRVWVNQQLEYFCGKSQSIPLHGPEGDHFMQWLGQKEVNNISKIHKRIHQLSDELSAQYENKNYQQVDNSISDLIVLRDLLVRSILDTLNYH
jgi:diguanylate cyclase (GGDEF)-like protein/PAS domain S-box-containing protein